MKFYILSPEGVPINPHLFPMMKPHFIDKGHSFVNRIEECDVVLIDLHVRQFDYNSSDIFWLLGKRIPVITFDEWDRGGMSKDDWPYPLTEQQKNIFFNIWASEIKSIHFCRLLDKNKDFKVFPYEKAIMYEEPMIGIDELFNRQYDICFIANESPSRRSIANAIEKDGRFKSIIRLAEPKIPFSNWVDAHRQAKFFGSASAGGYSNERPQNLFSISCHLQEETDQLLLHPFVHEETCLKISTNPTKEELDILYEYCNDKDGLYNLYSNNYNFMKKYYSAEYISIFMMSTIVKYI